MAIRRGRPRSNPIGLAAAALWLATASVAVRAAPAPDVILYGDPALSHALHDVAARFTAQTGVPVHLFSAPPALTLALLRHAVWNDVVVTLAPWMDQAVQAGVIEPGTRTGAWRTTLVIAAGTTAATGDRFAVTDPTPAASIDGPAVLAAAGLHPAQVQGVANGANVAFLLENGTASQGLLHLSEVRGNPKLRVVAPVADAAYAPIVYDAAVSTLTHSPNAHAFLDYLHSPAATDALQADGVEIAK